MYIHLKRFLSLVICTNSINWTNAAFTQSDEALYLENFDAINADSYAAIDDPDIELPQGLNLCKKNVAPFISPSSFEERIVNGSGKVSVSDVKAVCDEASICIIPSGLELEIDDNLNVAALIVRGSVKWNDTKAPTDGFVCSGYVAIEDNGSWNMNLSSKSGWIFIKDNGAYHPKLRTRAFGSTSSSSSFLPSVNIEGKKMERTWSLLSKPLSIGDIEMKLLHNPNMMGWKVGDRIGVAPTERLSRGRGQEFRIESIDEDGKITLNVVSQYTVEAEFLPPQLDGGQPMLKSGEVANLSRNIIITGDDFSLVDCDPNLPEAVVGEETSIEGCRCSSFRSKCTFGLHTIHMHHGVARIQNTRVEKCGQRGVEGKYCLHFHHMHDCPDCLFANNAIENSQQRGIIIHGTHQSLVENNVLYNVRGSGIYVEDGNEMLNQISYNIYICNYPFSDNVFHGCTVPGTSNRIADTKDNQAGIFSRSATNDLIGNRSANGFNGMLISASSIGRGSKYGKVCEADGIMGRIEGNTFHGNGRFGTYTLSYNYPKLTDRSVASDGENIDKSLCQGFDDEGSTKGVSTTFKNNVDYGNAFVGHYEAGDIQYYGHQSFDNNNLLYWKETKNFENGCSAHVSGSTFSNGNVALPDIGTFIIENTTFSDKVTIEANHHCNVGTTGFLCFPQYFLHNVKWLVKKEDSQKWFYFQYENTQAHTSNQNHGGIISLSPVDADTVMNGRTIQDSFFPPGYVSLVSSKFDYLLSMPGNICELSTSIGLGELYDNGILCRAPLRALRVYSKRLLSNVSPPLRVDIFHRSGGISQQTNTADATTYIPYHQTGGDFQSRKQGYAFPVVVGLEHSYRLGIGYSNEDFPLDWVVEYSDTVVGNRWAEEFIYLDLKGQRSCGQNGLLSSHHNRKYIWSGDEYLDENVWGNYGACTNAADEHKIACEDEGVMPSSSCSSLCEVDCETFNAVCDCRTETCRCKEGFMGHDCSIDLCDAARCGEHGHCTSRYLGTMALLPVTSEQACICDEGWSGPLCTFNPCEEQDLNCSGHGKCVAVSAHEAVCECDAGYSGSNCEESCFNLCPGAYPFGCSDNISGAMKYGCTASGGCNYLKQNEEYPYDGFCTFKDTSLEVECECEVDDCNTAGTCTDGLCSAPIPLPDNSPCNSVPYGICRDGVCIPDDKEISPAPTSEPVPTTSITSSPSSSQTFCGCKSCDQLALNNLAGAYSCGARIEWLQSQVGGSFTEYDACFIIGNTEFPDECGICDPTSCHESSTPTQAPVPLSSSSPSASVPYDQPSSSPTAPICGCATCDEAALNTLAGAYSCGARIQWLQSAAGGSLSEDGACFVIGNIEFPQECGKCNPTVCNDSPSPSLVPSKSPTNIPSDSPTPLPSARPTPLPTISHPCGCGTCDEAALSALAGAYSCGARIQWLQSVAGGLMSEEEACIRIGSIEFPLECENCDPNRCK